MEVQQEVCLWYVRQVQDGGVGEVIGGGVLTVF